MREARLSSDLPERFARLYDHHTGKFDTPLDDQGIVDIDGMFELAIRTYPYQLPDFRDTESNIHHVYRTENEWQELADSYPFPYSQIIHTFRNSTPQLAYVPRELHWWTEESQKAPPPPSLEVMERRNEAWSVASLLLKSAVEISRVRNKYEERKNVFYVVRANLEGLTPKNSRLDSDIERSDGEYWLSELHGRLESWRFLAEKVKQVPPEDRIVAEPKLFSVRALRRRIKNGAIVPQVPTELIAA